MEANADKLPPTKIPIEYESSRGYNFKPEQYGEDAVNPQDFDSSGTASGAAIRKPKRVASSVVPTSTDQRVGNTNATTTTGYGRMK